MALYNTLDAKELRRKLELEQFKRKTLSFYRYIRIDNPQEFRDNLYREWSDLNCFGRIYVAKEGINAQMSVPESNVDTFLNQLRSHELLKNLQVRFAIEDDGKSFFKLSLKVRPKLVADGLEDDSYDVSNVGNHLSPIEFHNLIGNSDTLVVDMRNHYESEVGKFENAICPKSETFREELLIATELLKDNKDKKILLYCTGGIRCEKASAYFKHQGFADVNQLYGGILEYAQVIKATGLKSKFTGKNFVFDGRLGERVTDEIISHCHQCGKLCDTHTNCANDDCHLLFIQCDECKTKYDACCSADCKNINSLSEEEHAKYRLNTILNTTTRTFQSHRQVTSFIK